MNCVATKKEEGEHKVRECSPTVDYDDDDDDAGGDGGERCTVFYV